MNRREFDTALLAGLGVLGTSGLSLAASSVAGTQIAYGAGSKIADDLFINDSAQNPVPLSNLFAQGQQKLNLLFLFGGGSLGFRPELGGLWCRDSYEDLHILRTLADAYSEEQLQIIPIACPPVFHSEMMGLPKRVFLDAAEESATYQELVARFIQSTEQAFERNSVTIKPYFDLRFRLLMGPQRQSLLPAYGEIHPWHGSFRAPDETQYYGVPNFWLAANNGEILVEPFRGNIYHPHGGTVTINYGVSDIIRAVDAHLS